LRGAAGTQHLLQNANYSRRSVPALPIRWYSGGAVPPTISHLSGTARALYLLWNVLFVLKNKNISVCCGFL